MGIPHHKTKEDTRIREKKVVRNSGFVEGIASPKLQSQIAWRGMAHLAQLNEDSECMLADAEWPKKSGKVYYACVSTGLLFDKQSGACYQSSKVSLRLDTVEPFKCTLNQFIKWRENRIASAPVGIVLKRGPKPKGYVAPEADTDD